NSQAWRAGELLEDVYRIDVPADAVAGPYAFSVGLYDDASRERLQATARDTGAPLGGQITLQPRPIVRWPGLYEQPASEHGCDYRFGEVGALVGWSTRAEAGTLMLELVWQAATAPATPEYVVFAHLRQGDALVAQHDGPPAEGKRPTVGWRQGEYVVDRRQIDLAGVPAGEYALYVGLYDPLTGERVSALDDGVALPSSEVLLGQIEVAP
ncbi:MAG: hypothetical protein ACOX3S_00145, partial [Anaerolineae bacterium]